MKMIGKFFQAVFVFLFCGCILAVLGLTIHYVETRPIHSGKIAVSPEFLKGKVSITRDSFGIVHIAAEKSDLDAWFALGYVHAQDRFWQMEFNRHVEQGSLSEMFGQKTIPQDKYLKTWGFYQSAAPVFAHLSPHAKAVIQSYTNGVNLYIAQHHYPFQFALLGLHPKPWTVTDSLAWQKVLAWDLQNVWKAKLNNYLVQKYDGASKIPVIFPPYPQDAPTILSDADLKQSGIFTNNSAVSSELNLVNQQDKGSNNWVVSGKWTSTGKPLLANDPHLEIQSPSMWYLAEIKAPGLDVTGATMPGMAGVVIGHNNNIAWGVTNVNPDVQDLYIIGPQFASQIKTVTTVIKVKNHSDLLYPIQYFHGMPVLSSVVPSLEKISSHIALQWTGFDPNDKTVQSIIDINYAKNWKQFVEALKNFNTPSQNFIYADTLGNIGYYLPGKIPLRSWQSDVIVPYDKKHLWSQYISFEKLPHVYNPPEGMITTANNLPVNHHYAYPINFRWSVPPYRAERIIKLLQQYKPLTLEKMQLIQLDNYSTLWEFLSPYLLKTVPLDADSQLGLQILKNWDGHTDTQSIGASVFAFWYRELDALMPAYLRIVNQYPEPLYIKQLLQNTHQKSLDDFLSRSLKTAIQKLILQYGNKQEQWQWGKIHHAVFEEMGLGKAPLLKLFWNRSEETPGGLYTVNAGTYRQDDFVQNDGASYRQIIDLNQLDRSMFILTLGQSNDPFCANYQDQLPLWQKGKYLSISTNAADWKKPVQLTLYPLSLMK